MLCIFIFSPKTNIPQSIQHISVPAEIAGNITAAFSSPDSTIVKYPDAALRRKFQKYCGMSPKQYLLKLRLNKATALLLQNKYTVKDIARRCGFSDEKHFSKTVKKSCGITPSEFARG